MRVPTTSPSGRKNHKERQTFSSKASAVIPSPQPPRGCGPISAMGTLASALSEGWRTLHPRPAEKQSMACCIHRETLDMARGWIDVSSGQRHQVKRASHVCLLLAPCRPPGVAFDPASHVLSQ